MNAAERCERALNRLCKWRSVFTGRILGTKPLDDAPTQGFRDIFDRLFILRAEATAISALCIERGLFTVEQFHNRIAVEADLLSEAYEKRFPGFRATDEGLLIDGRATETTKGWPA